MNEAKDLSLNSLINLIIDQYLSHYRSQKKLVASVFSSYYETYSDAYGYKVLPDQKMIRDLRLNKRATLPRNMRFFYHGCEGRQQMRKDMYRFVEEVTCTMREHEELLAQLLSLVSTSTNLDIHDKAYILVYSEVPAEHRVQELLARMMLTAYCYSNKKLI